MVTRSANCSGTLPACAETCRTWRDASQNLSPTIASRNTTKSAVNPVAIRRNVESNFAKANRQRSAEHPCENRPHPTPRYAAGRALVGKNYVTASHFAFLRARPTLRRQQPDLGRHGDERPEPGLRSRART